MSTPDITAAQIVALLTTLLAAGVTLFKLDLSDAQMAAAISGMTVLVTVGWQISDAVIRRGRAKVEVAKVQAQADTTAAAIYAENPATPVVAVAAQRDAP